MKLFDELRRFLELQRCLFDEIRRCHPGKLSPGLTFLPKSGALTVSDKEWLFERHGNGVLFTDPSTKDVVDIHDFFAGPEVVDAWRFTTYIEAKGVVPGELDAVNGEDLDEKVHSWFELLVARRALLTDGRFHRLSPDVPY